MKYEINRTIKKIQDRMLHGTIVNHYSFERRGFCLKFETGLDTICAESASCDVDVYVTGGREPILRFNLDLNNPDAGVDRIVQRLASSDYVF